MRLFTLLLLFLLLISPMLTDAQTAPFQIPLWKGAPPVCPREGNADIYQDKDIGTMIRDVRTPLIEAYLPPDSIATGTSVLIFPGGGYYLLAWDWEGTEMARWYNSMGIAAFVLRYRLPHWEKDECRSLVALADAQRAMRLLRSRAAEWKLDPQKIAVMGFSAGGHLASTLGTHFDAGQSKTKDPIEQQSCRPDALILMYPVVSGDTAVSHAGSFENLLGKNPTLEQVRYFSNETQVTAQTPPTLLIHATDDEAVPVENSIRFYEALRKQGISASLLIYPTGGHGFSFARHKSG
ncbi:MAG: alpha/beta hydrolase, partial [Bacteroidetes bacterium]